MCNTYVIRPKCGALGLAQRVSEATAKMAAALVRKSDPGVVVCSDGQAEIMRWGFHRKFNPAINNARSDKLEGGKISGQAIQDRVMEGRLELKPRLHRILRYQNAHFDQVLSRTSILQQRRTVDDTKQT